MFGERATTDRVSKKFDNLNYKKELTFERNTSIMINPNTMFGK